MKTKLLTTGLFILAMSLSIQTHARCVGPVVNGQCLGTMVPGTSDTQNTDRYRSNTGTDYQYNLGNPSDRNRYSIDLDAQRRDQMNTNTRRDLDRQSGQFGGGIYNN